MGTGSARAMPTPSGITAGSGGHVQGEGMLLRARGSVCLPCHQRACTGAALELLCPPPMAPSASSRDTETQEWLHQPGPGTPFLLCPQD